MKSLETFKRVCEELGASRDEAAEHSERRPILSSAWLRGIWWATLIGAILLFCGQTSKFIYIDF